MSQLIYNVTIQVTWSIHDAWLRWMRDEHIPDVVATGCFTQSRLLRLLDVDETEGPTYAAQYTAPGREAFDAYIENHAPLMRQKGIDLWGNGFIAFRTLMQVV
jgi:Domain of unknown function (DUF4286)